MESTQAVRTAIYNAIRNITVSGKVIPVFDGIVNPIVSIPSINGASCYIVLQDQQENTSGIQNMCNERLEQNITIRIVTKFATSGVTDRTLSETVANIIKKAIRTGRSHNLVSPYINIQKVEAPIVQQTDEFANGQTALSKILIYSITVNQ